VCALLHPFSQTTLPTYTFSEQHTMPSCTCSVYVGFPMPVSEKNKNDTQINICSEVQTDECKLKQHITWPLMILTTNSKVICEELHCCPSRICDNIYVFTVVITHVMHIHRPSGPCKNNLLLLTTADAPIGKINSSLP